MKDRKKSVILAIVLTAACLLLSGVIFLSYDNMYHYQVTDISHTSRYFGDVSGDFRIDWDDVTALQALCNTTEHTQWDTECADLNQDGLINREDTALLLRYLSVSDAWTLQGIDAYCEAFRSGQE